MWALPPEANPQSSRAARGQAHQTVAMQLGMWQEEQQALRSACMGDSTRALTYRSMSKGRVGRREYENDAMIARADTACEAATERSLGEERAEVR